MKEPIPIVRGAEQAVVAQLRIEVAGLRTNERNALERALRVGQLLQNYKVTCPAGDYYPALEKIGLSPQQANKYLRLHEWTTSPAGDVSDCDSIQSALEKMQLQKLNRQGESPPADEDPAGREPGDDTEEEARQPARGTGKNGAALFDWRGYEKPLGVVNRLPDLLARAYPEARATEDYRAASAALDEFSRRWAELKKRLTGRRK